MHNISIFGTSSDAGSTVTWLVGRLLQEAGYSVAPFKAQNVSNNAHVAFEGASLNEEKTETLLEYYDSEMDTFAFRAYIRYALLYYATVRYAGGRDYRILLKRLERMI